MLHGLWSNQTPPHFFAQAVVKHLRAELALRPTDEVLEKLSKDKADMAAKLHQATEALALAKEVGR